MISERSEEARETFKRLSNDYAEALKAFETIDGQSSTLMLLGSTDELHTFLDQFLEMAKKARREAEEAHEPHFGEWFTELIEKAESLRSGLLQL